MTVHADELQPGDLIVYNGRPHKITDVKHHAGWSWPVALDDTGWAIALSHQVVEVHRDTA